MARQELDITRYINHDEIGVMGLDLRLLIREVKKRPLLWDLRLACHGQSTERTWQEVANTLDTDVRTCRVHWANLRRIFSSEKRRVIRRMDRIREKTTRGAAVTSSWVYYDYMKFVDDVKFGSYRHFRHGDADMHSMEQALCADNGGIAGLASGSGRYGRQRAGNLLCDVCTSYELSMQMPVLGNQVQHEQSFSTELNKEEVILMNAAHFDLMREDITRRAGGNKDYMFLLSFMPQMKRMSHAQKHDFRCRIDDALMEVMMPGVSADELRTQQRNKLLTEVLARSERRNREEELKNIRQLRHFLTKSAVFPGHRRIRQVRIPEDNVPTSTTSN